jgi:hypothetical protein
MSELLDRLGSWAAERVMRWIASRAAGTHREWVSAMRSEMRAIDGGVDQLRWVLGGVPMAWRMGNTAAIRPRITLGVAVKRNLLAAVSFAVLNLLTIVAIRMNGRNDRPDLHVMVLICVGMLAANRMGARFVTALLTGSLIQFLFVRTSMIFGVLPWSFQIAPWVAATAAMWFADPQAWSARGARRGFPIGMIKGFLLGESLFAVSLAVSANPAYLLRGPLGSAHVNLLVCALCGALAGRVIRTPERRATSV